MKVENAQRTGIQTTLNKCVIFSEVCGMELTSQVVVEDILPTGGEAEDIELVITDKMLHLGNTD